MHLYIYIFRNSYCEDHSNWPKISETGGNGFNLFPVDVLSANGSKGQGGVSNCLGLGQEKG